MAGWYELSRTDAGKYRFVLKAENGDVILTSQSFEAKEDAESAIAGAQESSQVAGRYERRISGASKPHFVVKTAVGKVLGTSEAFESEAARKEGIALVQANGATTDVRDLTA